MYHTSHKQPFNECCFRHAILRQDLNNAVIYRGMMSTKTFRFNGSEFCSDDGMSKLFEIRKAMRRKYSFPTIERFEAKTYLGIISVLSNKIIKILNMSEVANGYSFACSIEDGVFKDLADVELTYRKLLHIDSSIFDSFVDSAQLFHDSLVTKEIDYSAAFVLLVFSLENIPNRIYSKKQGKKQKLVRFAKKYVTSEKFTQSEIRQLEFDDSRKMNVLFEKLLFQSYKFRCNYVHDARMIPPLSQVADRMSMAFISNDYTSIFPSYSWLRRVTHIALTNFLIQEPSKGKNSIDNYFDRYETGRFTAKKAIQSGQLVTDNDVYLQRLHGF